MDARARRLGVRAPSRPEARGRRGPSRARAARGSESAPGRRRRGRDAGGGQRLRAGAGRCLAGLGRGHRVAVRRQGPDRAGRVLRGR
ncbi:MAG: hypothetical protein F4Y98_02880 [Chloroflexi bacterium]|nr:hypothetical protein [Chloroflexota bacterium]